MIEPKHRLEAVRFWPSTGRVSLGWATDGANRHDSILSLGSYADIVGHPPIDGARQGIMVRSSGRRRKRQQRSAQQQNGGSASRSQRAESERLTTVDSETFLETRRRRGAERVNIDDLMAQSEIVFRISEKDIVSQLCIECFEFTASASRNAAAAVEVLERLDHANDPHLITALKKYVEDTGQALKEVDNRLKRARSSLEDLFPEIPGKAQDATTWRNLIRRRDVIAHRILSVDDIQVREEANRDFRTLYSLLRNIHFVPTMTNFDRGRSFAVGIRSEVLRRLPPVKPGGESTELGMSVVLVCEDIQHDLLVFRLARSPHDRLLIASTYLGNIRITCEWL